MVYQESHRTDDVSVTISTKFMQFGSIYLLEDLQSAGTFLVKTVSEDTSYVDCTIRPGETFVCKLWSLYITL